MTHTRRKNSMSPAAMWLWTLLLVGILGVGAAALVAAETQTIVDIKVRGNAKVESDAIIALLKSQRGGPMTTKNVQEDINKLFDWAISPIFAFSKKRPLAE